MSRRPKDELPDLMDAFNTSVSDNEAGYPISSQNNVEEALRRIQEKEELEQMEARRNVHLDRFRREREIESREQDSLSHSHREVWETTDKGVTYIDVKDMPETEQWAWISESLRNQPNQNNMLLSLRKGWVPVRPEECKHLCINNEYASEFGLEQKSLVKLGGLVLMKRPKKVHLAERANDEQQARQIEREIEELTAIIGNKHGIGTVGVNYQNHYRSRSTIF